MPQIEHDRLKLGHPAGWQDVSQIIAVGPPDAQFRQNLVAVREPVGKAETAKAYARQKLGELRRALQGLSVVKEGPASYGPNRGFFREHTFTAEGRKLSQLQLYVVDEGVATTVTFTDLTQRLPQSRKLAEQAFADSVLGR